ncbi:hypothetical protein K505DRAFT_207556, partial [Melanomma pulvis-pyrius CBS 109.77]
LIPRFRQLLETCTTIIHTHGPYRIENHIFKRAATPPTDAPLTREIAASLACAQDALPYPQPLGPENDDLQVLKSLWDTTLQILASILVDTQIPLPTFGWGVYGLSSGYVPHNADLFSTAVFQSRKARLHAALQKLPSMSAEHVQLNREAPVVQPAGQVAVLAKTNREVHINATMLVQIMRGDGGWEEVRWFHAICVVERWADALRL